jgi:hypothetical protein
MNKKLIKQIMVFVMLLTILTPMLVVKAQTTDDPFGITYGNSINGLTSADPRVVAKNLIQVILGFLGIIAVVIILLGGFKWMTAAGNEDKVGEAKKIIVAGVIGLIIILGAWAIANFVLTNVMSAISTNA